MSKPLNPCPYCAGEVRLDNHGTFDDRYAVECDACEVSWPSGAGLAETIKRWNRRTWADTQDTSTHAIQEDV